MRTLYFLRARQIYDENWHMIGLFQSRQLARDKGQELLQSYLYDEYEIDEFTVPNGEM